MDIFQELKDVQTLAENSAKNPSKEMNMTVLFEIAFRCKLMLKFIKRAFPDLDVEEL